MSRSAQEVGPFDPAGLSGDRSPFRAVGPLLRDAGCRAASRVFASLEDAVVHPRNGPRTSALAAGFPLTLLGIASWRISF